MKSASSWQPRIGSPGENSCRHGAVFPLVEPKGFWFRFSCFPRYCHGVQTRVFFPELLPTSPDWACHALANPEALLSDHAHCEKKAALTALSLLTACPHNLDLVQRLARLAEQETNHLRRVLEAIGELGYELQPDRGNPYAKALISGCRPGRIDDRLFAAAMIEARSHERLSLLCSAVHGDERLGFLSAFFQELEACERGHAATYLHLAASACEEPFADLLACWLERETEAISSVRPRSAVH